MSLEQIPRKYIYSCDVCLTTHESKRADPNGYKGGIPPGWGQVELMLMYKDEHKGDRPDGMIERTTKKLLCPDDFEAIDQFCEELIRVPC